MERKLKLKIELVPGPLWGRNLRSREVLGDHRWSKLRKRIIGERGTACAICGNTENLRAHEIWTYKERSRTGTATLVRIEIICTMCHDVHHFGRIELLHQKGIISDEGFKAVRQHFLTVNKCSRRDFEAQRKEAFTVWRVRSSKRWRIDYGPYAEAVQEAIAYRKRYRARIRERRSVSLVGQMVVQGKR